MKMGKPIREMVRLLLGLVIVAAVTIAIINTSRMPAPGGVTVAASTFPTSSPQQPATPPQTTTAEVPYPVPVIALTPSAVAAETAAAEAIYYTQQAATRQAYTPLPTEKAIYLPTGTMENGREMDAGKLLGIKALNGWSGIWDRKAIAIYAGATSNDPDQGVIAVAINSAPFGNFPTPTKHGGVRVVSEQGNRLTLVSTDGTTYYFDIPSRRFVASLTEVVPSATPPNTLPPTPTLHAIWTPISTPVPPTYNP